MHLCVEPIREHEVHASRLLCALFGDPGISRSPQRKHSETNTGDFMTCTECRILLDKHPRDCTIAECLSVVVHKNNCTDCTGYYRLQCHNRGTPGAQQITPEENKEFTRRFANIADDPELKELLEKLVPGSGGC